MKCYTVPLSNQGNSLARSVVTACLLYLLPTSATVLIIHGSCMFEAGSIYVTTTAQIRYSPGQVNAVSVNQGLQLESASLAYSIPHPSSLTQESI